MDNSRQILSSGRTYPGRALLFGGIFTAIAGIPIFFVQFSAKILHTPWYMPVMATIGAVLIIAALVKSQTKTRWIAAALFGLFAGFQWYAMLVMGAVPEYAGPVKVGEPFPQFATTLADGSPFNHENLKGDKNAILVFFRGHW